MRPEDLKRQRAAQEVLGRLITPMIGMKWAPFELEGMNAAWVRPERSYDRNHAILYCHGGGYTSGNLGYSRPLASKLSGVTGWDTLSFEYRLAPEHPFPAAVDDAMKAWDHLMRQGYGARDVTVAGDSAGGNLALVLCHRLKQEGRRLPARWILMSPMDGYDGQWEVLYRAGGAGPHHHPGLYPGGAWGLCPGPGADLPMLSPLFGDFRGFPPTLIQAGSNELLLSDSVRLRDRMQAAGVPCRLEVWTDMWHVFQMFPIKKAGQAMASVGRFLLEYT